MSIDRWEIIVTVTVLTAFGVTQFTLGDAIGWAAVVTLFLLFWVMIWFFWRRAGHRNSLVSDDFYLSKIAALDAEIRQLKQENAENNRRTEMRIAKLEKERDKLVEQARQHARLRQELEERELIEKSDKPVEPPLPTVVLAIWPDAPGLTPLDQQGEADALADAGFQYVALRGKRATRAGVIWEIDRLRPNIIQVGGHGDKEGIMLTDGITGPGWWGELVTGHGIELMVLLSCESSQQDELNVSDALIRAGVKAVISCDDKIPDVDAVRFSQLLYAKLGEGKTLAAAVQRAKLALSRSSAEMIRLREGG